MYMRACICVCVWWGGAGRGGVGVGEKVEEGLMVNDDAVASSQQTKAAEGESTLIEV